MAMERDTTNSYTDGSASYVPSAGSSSKPLVLHLGVIDFPYANPPEKKRSPKAQKGKKNKPMKPKGESSTQTTGDVAGYLETKYGVMQAFADQHLPKIAQELEESLAGALENVLMGAPAGNPFSSAESNITQMFKDFLSLSEIEQMGIEGVPTQAALDGVNHRLGRNRGPRRPSFIDTGLYQQSFLAWID